MRLDELISGYSQQILRFSMAGVASLAVASVSYGQTPAADRETVAVGERLVVGLCTTCHSVRANQPGPHKDAPALTGLSKNYPVEALAESLAEGIMTGHPDMPVFSFDTASIDGIIAYLESIQDASGN